MPTPAILELKIQIAIPDLAEAELLYAKVVKNELAQLNLRQMIANECEDIADDHSIHIGRDFGIDDVTVKVKVKAAE